MSERKAWSWPDNHADGATSSGDGAAGGMPATDVVDAPPAPAAAAPAAGVPPSVVRGALAWSGRDAGAVGGAGVCIIARQRPQMGPDRLLHARRSCAPCSQRTPDNPLHARTRMWQTSSEVGGGRLKVGIASSIGWRPTVSGFRGGVHGGGYREEATPKGPH
jgi:hypothetical protein